MTMIQPDNTTFVLLSFEGPDVYSQAGGLGVRATELCRSLAEAGFDTHLFFIGDPRFPGEESLYNGKFHLHRWCQWISGHHPNGVYDGEEGKIREYQTSIPMHVVENIVRPNAYKGKRIVVMAEEWQTTSTVINLHNTLKGLGLRNWVTILWNANNTYGFDKIDWWALQESCTVTTVSRYMKHIMWKERLNPMVIPNGIPHRLLDPLNNDIVKKIQDIYKDQTFLVKVGRYTPDKRWIMAIDAVAYLKHLGQRVCLVMRGGMEAHRGDVLLRARTHNLTVRQIKVADPTFDNIINTLKENRDADVVEMDFFIPEEFLRYLYRSADSVLANSGHEPFGLVGLEVMATGGIPFVGASGEDYAQSFQNSICVETDDFREVAAYLLYLQDNPRFLDKIRKNAHHTAWMYTWERVLEDLLGKIEFITRIYGGKIIP